MYNSLSLVCPCALFITNLFTYCKRVAFLLLVSQDTTCLYIHASYVCEKGKSENQRCWITLIFNTKFSVFLIMVFA